MTTRAAVTTLCTRRAPAVAAAAAGVLLALALAAAAAEPTPAASPAVNAPVTVSAAIEPTAVTIGTPCTLTVEVAAVPGTEVAITQPTEKIGDLEITDYGERPAAERDGRTVTTRWYRLVGWTPGARTVPAPAVAYRLPGQELVNAPGAEAHVEILSLLGTGSEPEDIRDIKDIEAVPLALGRIALVAAIVAALAGAAFLLWRLRRRRDRTPDAPPPRPAHVIAYEALERLRALRLAEHGAFKEYYSGLSDIVRTYVEQRFRMRAPEMTTEEFLAASNRAGVLAPSHRGVLGEFLHESDLVKFARHRPTVDDSERAWSAARRFVDETAERPAAAAADGAPAEPGAGSPTARAADPAPAPVADGEEPGALR